MTFPAQELEDIFNKILNLNLNSKVKCPKCNSDTLNYNKVFYMYRCRWTPCRNVFSVLKNTIFHSSKVKFLDILQVIKMWTCKVRTRSISELLNISEKSISKLLNKMGKK